MDNVNKTLYIPLYGKAYVSRKGIILRDEQAEKIWAAEGFALKGRSQSKWLAYYMGMRAAVFDDWVRTKLNENEDTIVVQIGCGLDGRVERVGTMGHNWYDVDFPDVIEERKRYYEENSEYHMVGTDARDCTWIEVLPKERTALIMMEGVSMYFVPEEMTALLTGLRRHFRDVYMLIDCYSVFAAKASKCRNPINDVDVTQVYGIDSPHELTKNTGLVFVQEHEITPGHLINQLQGSEKVIFKSLYGGKLAEKLYRLYEYRSDWE